MCVVVIMVAIEVVMKVLHMCDGDYGGGRDGGGGR